MKNKSLLYSLLLLFVLVIAGCYEDEGNYDYSTVNEVMVKIEKNYGVRKLDTVFVIRPEIKQNLVTDLSNLQFEWYHNTFSDQTKGDLISTADTVAIEIHPDSANFSYNHFLRLYIHDEVSGADYMFPVLLKVAKKYEGAWMVLHKDLEGTKLGAVEYIGEEMDVTDDVYFKERGKRLRGEPSALGVANYFSIGYPAKRTFFLFTDDPKESGVLYPDEGFIAYDTVAHFVYPNHASYFNPADVKACEGEGRGRICLSNGNLFQGNNYNAKLYKARAAANIPGEVKISHATSAGWTFVVYDEAGHRFLHFYNDNYSSLSNSVFDESQDNVYEIEYIKEFESNANNNLLKEGIDPAQKVIYLGTGYWYGPAMTATQGRVAAYGLALNTDIGYAYVYEFHGGSMWRVPDENDYPFPFYTSFKIPSGMNENTPVTSSIAYNRILFYAVDNKVYRLDFGAGGITTLIYQHPDASARATVMKFAKKDVGAQTSYTETYTDYGYNVFRSLGVAFELGNGEGEMVVLNLNSAGKVDKNDKFPSAQEHKGFGKIKDILFL